ncbi:MAG: GGDEF domain-containing protein [Spirochaetaceae bacterium]|nr:GGDEF domain-containing protein [Spirochaetaceae bacterium]
MEKQEYLALDHIKSLLKDRTIPPLEGELAEIPVLREIHEELKEFREVLAALSRGSLSPTITQRGFISGCIKDLQTQLRHFVRQARKVEQGDFTRKVRFIGEFPSAFNRMVRRMNVTLEELKHKEEVLTALADSLRSEVDLRNSAVEALRQSESQFKYLASHDSLTGALNRRSFMDRAMIEIAAAVANRVSCGIVMMDLDHFKQFNDTYGHPAGDEALRHVVTVVSAFLRKNDFLGRYGGEEFVFYFSYADRTTGIAIAERVREAIANTPVQLRDGAAFISASFGVAMALDGDYPGEINDLETCIHNADIALYQAKKAGRNRVVCYVQEEEQAQA